MEQLPQELIDQIILETGDLNLAISLKNDYAIKKIYNHKKHTFSWAAEKGL